MAKYDTALRNSRMAANQAAFLGGTILLCQGAVPTALAAPAAGSILSRHPILGNGSISGGKLTYADADIATDASADNGEKYGLFNVRHRTGEHVPRVCGRDRGVVLHAYRRPKPGSVVSPSPSPPMPGNERCR